MDTKLLFAEEEIVTFPDYLFHAPCTVTIAGPSGSGKTSIAMDILRYRQEIFSQRVRGVVYCYSEFNEVFNDPPGGGSGSVIFHRGLPSEEQLYGYIDKFAGDHFLLFYDDLMSQVASSSMAQDVACKLSHHRNFSCISLTQNIFVQGRNARNQSLNSMYYLLTRSCRDLRQISTLGNQLFPGRGAKFVEAYMDSVDKPFVEEEEDADVNDETTMATLASTAKAASPTPPTLPVSSAGRPHVDVPALYVSCHPVKTERNFQLLSSIFPPGGGMVLYRI